MVEHSMVALNTSKHGSELKNVRVLLLVLTLYYVVCVIIYNTITTTNIFYFVHNRVNDIRAGIEFAIGVSTSENKNWDIIMMAILIIMLGLVCLRK